ncbi:MAG TPA: putative PEP-binding protein, partial [Stellaceae bacterium]|nr:putative PEP-binding protein [Stellaceae bacterium]
LVDEGRIGRADAIRRIEPDSLEQLLHPTLDPAAKAAVLARGLPASPGAASGKIVFSADAAETAAANGEAVILVRVETSPEDIHGMHAARGILTTRGGMTSHAAVVARGMGRPCVSGAGDLRIDYAAQTMSVRNHLLHAGDLITLNGSTGEVMQGEVPTIQPQLSGDFATLMGWADGVRKLKVRANAETPIDAQAARDFGAEGIGLARTEHMFFEADRIGAMRQMIMADEEKGRRAALAKLLPMQRADFTEIFRIMQGLPVTIRLLDPPLHEFLPKTDAEFDEMARLTGKTVAEVRHRAQALHETNPMLGHRGCRLGITYPEIYETQAVAIFEAAAAIISETGGKVEPEIMMPLIATRRELDILKVLVDRVAHEVMKRARVEIPYLVGTMVELPRAALLAGDIARSAEFFSFGTNDLTQTVYGISRDDSVGFVGAYQKAGILAHDPFVSLDTEGVGEMIKIAAARGRAARPTIKLGICGEHGGDPASIHFCHELGLDYVSCSPYRVPIARLAAAQAELAAGTDTGTA